MNPGDDPRLQLARLIRGVRNELRREGRPASTRFVMQRLYDHCLEWKLDFRESRAIAGWYYRVALYAMARPRKPLDRRNNSVTR